MTITASNKWNRVIHVLAVLLIGILMVMAITTALDSVVDQKANEAPSIIASDNAVGTQPDTSNVEIFPTNFTTRPPTPLFGLISVVAPQDSGKITLNY